MLTTIANILSLLAITLSIISIVINLVTFLKKRRGLNAKKPNS